MLMTTPLPVRTADILVPYHLDDALLDFDWPIAAAHVVLPELPAANEWNRLAALYDQVADAVARETRLTIVMSGDCLTSLGTVAGLQRKGIEPAIVWFDGHGDVQTLETSTSGYIGGMPLRMLVGYGRQYLSEPLGLRTTPEERVLLVDARDLDPPEVEYLAQSRIKRCRVDEVVAERLPDGPIYLHLDVDVVDPEEVPGLLFPASGGPTLSAVTAAVQRVMDSGRVAALGLACTWHSHRGGGDALRDAAARIFNGAPMIG